MNYESFLEFLADHGWSVRGKSYATFTCGEWQLSFIRFGGKFQKPGMVTFVVCARHRCLRDLEKCIPAESKNPNDYPFKLTLAEIKSGPIRYQSRLLNYELSDYPMVDDWLPVYDQIRKAGEYFGKLDSLWLQGQMDQLDSPGYIERIWIEDLAAQQGV